MRSLLPKIEEQTIRDVEVIMVDNDSTDGAVELARAAGCRVFNIPSDSFSFGRALNIGLEEARGDIAIIISAHCLPKDEFWLEHLIGPMSEDGKIAGVYGRQIPFDDASPIERRGLAEAFPSGDGLRMQTSEMFSNAHSAVDVSVWKNFRFDEDLTGAEDIEWCGRVRQAGYSTAYEPRSVVYHSHKETLKGVYRRFYREALALDQFENRYIRPFGVLGAILRWARSVCLDWKYLVTDFVSPQYLIKWFFLIPIYRSAVYYGQYKAIRITGRKR